jgi:hypothetical protein
MGLSESVVTSYIAPKPLSSRDAFFRRIAVDSVSELDIMHGSNGALTYILHMRHPTLGYTAVDWAIIHGSVRCLAWLLKHGFHTQLNEKSAYDTTPLTLCAGPGYAQPDSLILVLSKGGVFGWSDAFGLAMKRFAYGLDMGVANWDTPPNTGCDGTGGKLERCAMAFYSASQVPCMPVTYLPRYTDAAVRYLKTKYCRHIGLCLLRKGLNRDVRRLVLESYLEL